MVVNGSPNEMTSTGDYVGLNLDQPLYLAGVPDGTVDDYSGYKNSFQGIPPYITISPSYIATPPSISIPPCCTWLVYDVNLLFSLLRRFSEYADGTE